MKYFAIIPALLLFSCTKNDVKLNTGWNSLYHIENGDTLSYMHFPNSFTPDEDGTNDIYYVLTSEISTNNYELQIYRKSGEVLFKSTDFQVGWDGTSKGIKSANGIYYYTLKASDVSGHLYEADGSMYLMR